MKGLLFRVLGAGVLAAVLSVGVFTIGAQPAPDAPFLYYYSAEQGAFIVERADGSESRVLAEYVLDEGYDNEIFGPGWSPSGNWFVWTQHSASGGSAREDFELSVVRREGGTPIKLLEGGQIDTFDWSPTNDLLLVSRYGIQNEYDIEFFILDVERQGVIFNLKNSELKENYYAMEWTPDGRYALLYFTQVPQSLGYYEQPHTMRLISPDGRTIGERRFYPGVHCALPNWSQNGKAVYIAENQETLVVEDFNSDTLIEIDAPDGIILVVDWNMREDYALVYTGDSCAPIDYELQLVSLSDQRSESLAQDAAPPRSISYLFTRLYPPTQWSSTGNIAFFITYSSPSCDSDVHMVALPTSAQDAVHLTLIDQSDCRTDARWNTSGERLLYTLDRPGSNDAINSYDLISQEISPVVPQVYYPGYFFALSPDERYLMYVSEGRGYLADLTFNIHIPIPWEDIIGTGTMSATEAIWHPTQPWLFAMSGWGMPWYYLNVTNVTTSIHRDLRATCLIGEESCFGWLPDVRELDGSE